MKSLSLRGLVGSVLVLAVAALAPPAAAERPSFDTSARNAIVVDYETGAVLLDKNADERMPPASMSKIMTAYIVFDLSARRARSSSTTLLPVSEQAWRTHSRRSTRCSCPSGARVKVEDLLRGMIIQSGNDACVVLAEGLAGSEEAFVEQMNETAKKLGLTNSHFANVDGLPDPERLHDGARSRDAGAPPHPRFPEYYHYEAEKEFTYNDIKQGNRNPLLYKDLGVDGMKTGHTEEAGYGLTVSAVRDDRRIIVVLAGHVEHEGARRRRASACSNGPFASSATIASSRPASRSTTRRCGSAHDRPRCR